MEFTEYGECAKHLPDCILTRQALTAKEEITLRGDEINNHPIITLDFRFCLNDLKRRIVILRNDLRAFKQEQKDG